MPRGKRLLAPACRIRDPGDVGRTDRAEGQLEWHAAREPFAIRGVKENSPGINLGLFAEGKGKADGGETDPRTRAGHRHFPQPGAD